MRPTSRALGTVMTLAFILLTPSIAQASGGLQGKIADANPSKPAIQLTNASARACQVLDTAQGTVAITHLVQDGKTIEATPIDSAADDDIGYLLKGRFKTLQPGESLALPLQSYALAAGQTVRAVTWSADGGSYVSEYVVVPDKPLQFELSYTMPIVPESGDPACDAPVFIATTSGGSTLTRLWYAVGGAVVVLACVAAVLYYIRRRKKHGTTGTSHHSTAKAVVLILTGAGILGVMMAPRASAEVTADPSLQSSYDACLGTLEANRDITGPALDALDAAGVHVRIVPTTGGSETTGYRDGANENFTIYWNPNDRHAYAGTGGNADPCTSLYHEMYHVLDMHNGTFSRNDCAGSGIETKEVMATRAQNVLRERLGMPPRSHYGDRELPSGDCDAPPSTPTCTGEHCADTNGDPHLRTFDGLRYDFQAAGEFVAARAKDNSFEVQVRQQPWGESRSASINTAVAFRVGKDRVELRSGRPLTLLINGKTASVHDTTLPGGGTITIEKDVVVLHWENGSAAYVRGIGSYGVIVSVQAGEDLAGQLDGLFGNADGSLGNDLHAQGNKKTIKPEFDQLYPSFADSWRITDNTSLFTYEKNESTATFTDKSMPEKATKPKSIPGYAAAERYCKSLGLTDPDVIANCALDMAITGQAAFAKAAYYSQAFASGTAENSTSWQFKNVVDGEPITQTFRAKAGDKVFVHVPKADLPDQCGTLTLLDPDAQEIANGCIIYSKGFIDGTVLPADGEYTIRLKPRGSGSVAIKLVRIADVTGRLAVDGDSITATISQPGVVARYTFRATAGQRVYVDVPNSTLGSECGILKILAPDGSVVRDGCIISNKGNIDTILLPTSGDYTLTLDPHSTTIGTARIRLTPADYIARNIGMNGSALSIDLKKPGSVAVLSFTGSAGQGIFVDMPSSELPSQCGILVLRGPDGREIDSGCIIGGKGSLSGDVVTLPTSGTFTLTLDPHGNATGATRIQLRDRTGSTPL